jgi:hypothetical protein
MDMTAYKTESKRRHTIVKNNSRIRPAGKKVIHLHRYQ